MVRVCQSSPRRTAFAVARLSPAIDAVGEICFGQRSVQLTCVWQLWQPASPATARNRSERAPSRTSLINVHARFSAAGPR